MGEGQVTNLLVLSQVILSFQLPFAVVPLVQFTSERAKMGEFANPRWAAAVGWAMAAGIIFLNALLIYLLWR
jgi:manganese transport protein